jgi:ADP-ribosylglycohydrolase
LARVLPDDHAARIARARLSLDGLSVGDAFGERFFAEPETVRARIAARSWPDAAIWKWTDDTAMAASIVDELDAHGEIDRDSLAKRLAASFLRDRDRGYGRGAQQVLSAIGEGHLWDVAAMAAFGGQGSMGNGAAMRSAPIGAYFADDPTLAAGMGALSADPTHAHPDARAGAAAVSVAASLAARTTLTGAGFLEVVHAATPPGPTRDGIAKACTLEGDAPAAAKVLGSGQRALCSDTVPFALWCASRHLGDWAHAMWATVSGLGDRDTTCAIVGGIVALRTPIPAEWLARREPLA